MKTRSLQTLLLIAISVLIGYYLGISQVSLTWQHFQPHVTFSSKEPPVTEQNINFSLFWDVWQRLEKSYYDKKALDSQKLFYGAISGMVAGLDDPYTVFLPPTQNSDFKQVMAGQFEGIGAELGMRDKQIIIIAPLDGSPAKKAGIQPGDAIVKVDDKPTFGWTLAQAVDKIRGPKGTSVKLIIIRKNRETPLTIAVSRDTIIVKSVDGWVKKVSSIDKINSQKTGNANAEVAYIRLSQFGDNTNDEWVATINTLYSTIKKDQGVKGLILDLRNNPGGYLTEATFIASEFIKDGTVVIEDKGNGDKTPFTVSRNGLLTDIPLVVLINGGSASASEIVAGALHDHNRAKLIGETSFGKGTIQQAEDLGNGAGLHITIAKWLTPNGTWVHGKGLTPDIAVVSDQNDATHDAQLEKAVQDLVQ